MVPFLTAVASHQGFKPNKQCGGLKMNLVKLLVMAVLGVFGVILALKIVGAILGWALHGLIALVVPVAVLVGVLYIIYRISDKKSLSDGNRGILP